MAQDDAGLNPVILHGIILAAMLSALAFVVFFILPDCASLPVWGKSDGECGLEKMGIILVSSVMFLAGAGYSLYRLLSAAGKGRKE